MRKKIMEKNRNDEKNILEESNNKTKERRAEQQKGAGKKIDGSIRVSFNYKFAGWLLELRFTDCESQ